MTRQDNCPYCDKIPPDSGLNPICDRCQETYRQVWRELYDTDPEFRAEADRWHPVCSPEGQAILSKLDTL